MGPSANIDMEAIRSAISRRSGGGATPALSQVTSPGATLPTGGPNTPTTPPSQPPMPTGTPAVAPSAPRPQGQPQGQPQPKLKQVGNFDDETRGLAKNLISKLMNVL